jgi:hypothetical protein
MLCACNYLHLGFSQQENSTPEGYKGILRGIFIFSDTVLHVLRMVLKNSCHCVHANSAGFGPQRYVRNASE